MEELVYSLIECSDRDVRQIEVHMAEPLVPGTNSLEIKIAIAKLKELTT
jgi:hypothetical protein